MKIPTMNCIFFISCKPGGFKDFIRLCSQQTIGQSVAVSHSPDIQDLMSIIIMITQMTHLIHQNLQRFIIS